MKILNFFSLEIEGNRIFGLDILRAMAILFVVFGHGASLVPPAIGTMMEYFTMDGVSIFFVLSGFLIGGILIKVINTEGVSFNSLFHFWIRRWMRTLPAYFFVLILLAFLFYYFEPGFSFGHTKRYFIFLQNFNIPHPGFFAEAWSLSIEEWFYLISPSLIFILIRVCKLSTTTAILSTVVAIILLTVLFRLYRYMSMPINTIGDWDGYFRKQVITRLDSLMFGVIGAYIFYFHNSLWKQYKVSFFILGLLMLIIQQVTSVIGFAGVGLYQCVFSFLVSSTGTLFLLPYLSELKTGRGVLFKILTYVSLISYSMYLLNLSVVQWITLRHMNFYGLSGLNLMITKYLLFWIFTIVGATLLFKYVERPFISMRKKFD